MEEVEQKDLKKRFRFGWRFLSFLLLGQLSILSLVFAWWYNSDADLDAVRERAVDLGIATGYEDLYSNDVDVELEAAIDEIIRLQEEVFYSIGLDDDFDYDEELLVGFNVKNSIYPGRELDQVSLQYYKRQEMRGAYRRIRDLIVSQKGKRFRVSLRDKQNNKYDRYTLSDLVSLIQILADYSFSGNQQEYLEAIDLMIDINAMAARDDHIAFSVNVAMVGCIINVMECRFDSVPLEKMLKCRTVYQGFFRELQAVQEHWFVSLLEGTERGLFDQELATIYGVNSRSGWDMFISKVKMKYARSYYLNFALDIASVKCNSLEDLDKYEILLEEYIERHFDRWYGKALNVLNRSITYSIGSLRGTGSRLDLLIAIKQGAKLPRDAFGNPYREIIKDGKLLGYYSIGEDGVDDGWESEDYPIWLYGYIEHP